LRIDSESVSDPSHPAFGCIAHLNEILTKYDLVIASPSLETGVSIDIKGHFSAVWGIFQGVQSANSVRQMLARLRETVDRHIWVRGCGKRSHMLKPSLIRNLRSYKTKKLKPKPNAIRNEKPP
jgi:hypothetical protein